MRLCVIGRGSWLLDAARRLAAAGHAIAVVVTAKETAEASAGADDFQAFATDVGASFFRSVDASRADIVDILVRQQADLAITMNFPGIFDERFVDLFPRGVINCHGSLLPRYRGNACPNWAIATGDDKTGLTLHLVQAGQLDSGPILLQQALKIGDETDIGDVYRWFDDAIPEAFVTLVAGLANGALTPREQDERLATYAFPRRPEDGRLDFRRSVDELLRLIRASTRPFAGAFCFFENETRVTVWRARRGVVPGPVLAAPGQVLHIDHQGCPTIWCQDGPLTLVEFDVAQPVTLGRRTRLS